jgi:hypothetical protein
LPSRCTRPADLQQPRPQQRPAPVLGDLLPHHDVGLPGLVLQRHEHHALGAAGPLAVDDDAGAGVAAPLGPRRSARPRSPGHRPPAGPQQRQRVASQRQPGAAVVGDDVASLARRAQQRHALANARVSSSSGRAARRPRWPRLRGGGGRPGRFSAPARARAPRSRRSSCARRARSSTSPNGAFPARRHQPPGAGRDSSAHQPAVPSTPACSRGRWPARPPGAPPRRGARILHELRGRVETHRLAVEQRAGRPPANGTSARRTRRPAARSSRRATRGSRTRRSPGSGKMRRANSSS